MHLHLISFNIPYPANYGGVIDVYYKLKALHEEGVKVILHCFKYDREEAQELEELCEKVIYYDRIMGFKGFKIRKPYIVSSRKVPALLDNLLKDEHPILFEGLHTCGYLDSPELKNRIKIVRLHNIEWEYYLYLGMAERNLLRRLFFEAEYRTLRHFEKKLKHANVLLAISKTDEDYYKKMFSTTQHIPPFHGNSFILPEEGPGEFVLYHGNLSVNENHKAAMFLVNHVFDKLSIPLVIAGLNPRRELIIAAGMNNFIKLYPNISDREMQYLLRKAQINILPTFQATGIKLKLINALYKGRYIITNSQMLAGTGLESLCLMADTADAMKRLVKDFMFKEFSKEEVKRRGRVLGTIFSNENNARRIIEMIEDEQNKITS